VDNPPSSVDELWITFRLENLAPELSTDFSRLSTAG
jgi:hypothetical protein